MQTSFEVDHANKVGRWALSGRITDELFQQGLRELSEVLAGLDLAAGIIDLTKATSFEVSDELLRAVAASDPVLAREMIRLVVAPEDQAYVRSKMFAALSEVSRPNLFVVRSIESAYSILGIKSPAFQAFVPSA